MITRLTKIAKAICTARNTDLQNMGEDLKDIMGGDGREPGLYPGFRLKGEIAPEGFASALRDWAEGHMDEIEKKGD